MEKLTAAEIAAQAKRIEAADRSESPATSTRKLVNCLLLLGDRIKPGTSISGDVVRSLVAQVASRGFSIPGDKFSVTELRSMQPAFNKAVAGITLPFEASTTAPVSKFTDAELKARHQRQQKQFEAMLKAEEKPDPLSLLADKRAARPIRKGQLSAEDQALYEQHKRLTGR